MLAVEVGVDLVAHLVLLSNRVWAVFGHEVQILWALLLINLLIEEVLLVWMIGVERLLLILRLICRFALLYWTSVIVRQWMRCTNKDILSNVQKIFEINIVDVGSILVIFDVEELMLSLL